MAFHRFLSAILFLVLYTPNFSDCSKEKEEALKDLGIDTTIVFDDLEVIFGSSTIIQFGNTVNLKDVKVQPSLKLKNFTDNKFHTLAMVDPDAPSRSNPVAAVRLLIYEYDETKFSFVNIGYHICIIFLYCAGMVALARY